MQKISSSPSSSATPSFGSPHSRIVWYDSPRKYAISVSTSSSVKSWSAPQMLETKVLQSYFTNKLLWTFTYRSAISRMRSVFFVSHTTTDGKCVSQSRNDVSTTKLMALCWNASIADIISRADATQDKITHISQNTRSTKWICSSMRNRTPCNDEFAIYSFTISLQRPILRTPRMKKSTSNTERMRNEWVRGFEFDVNFDSTRMHWSLERQVLKSFLFIYEYQ